MALINTKEIEQRAADLAVAELGAVRAELRDTGTLGVQIRDYDIVFADGHEEPLEVTTSADPMVLNTMHRMEGKNRIAAAVKRSWVVSAPYTSTDAARTRTAFDRRRCVALLVPLIERLDAEGHERLDTTRLAYAFGSPHQREAHELLQMGVRSGLSYEPSDPKDEPVIWLQTGSGGAYGSDNVTEALQRAAADEGNQAKLNACAGAARRHLFVVLTSASETLEWVALLGVLEGTHPLPPVPALPDAITTIWASTMDRGIYITPPGDWQTFGEPLAQPPS